jgi:hypothetical protein
MEKNTNPPNSRVILSYWILLLFLLVHPDNQAQKSPGGVGNTIGSENQPQLNFWIHTSDVDQSGNKIIRMNDQSGNDFHAEQNTVGLSPEQTPNVLNGHPAAGFNANYFLQTPGMPFNINGFSYIGVSKSNHTGTDKGTLLQSPAWLGDWEYRQKITIQGQAGAGTNYEVLFKIGESAGAAGFDFYLDTPGGNFPNDIRFTDVDGETLLNYWIEETIGTTPNQTLNVWVKVEANLDTNQDIYVYYGNSTASSASDPFSTFLFFDDFNRPNISDITVEDAYTKTNGGTWSIENNRLKNVGGSGDPNKLLIESLGMVNHPVMMKTRVLIETFGNNDLSRAGLAVCNVANGEGYSVLFRNNKAERFKGLNDKKSWGSINITNPAWSLNNWYNLEYTVLEPASKKGLVRFWDDFTAKPSFQTIDFGNGSARAWGYIGFAGSRTSDVSWFEEILVRKYIANEPAFSSLGTPENISDVTANKFIHQYEGSDFYTSFTLGGHTEELTGTGTSGFSINGFISDAENGYFLLNGSQTQNTYSSAIDRPSLAQFTIGRNGETGTMGFDGQMAEMIIFNDLINDAQRIIVENYLSSKYNLPLTANSHYSHQSYTNDLIGIGITEESSMHTITSGNGTGLYLKANNNSLDDKTHSFLMAAHDGSTHGTTSANIDINSAASNRWTRSWYIKYSGVRFDVALGFHFGEVAQAVLPDQLYTLLYRADTNNDFTNVPGAIAAGNDENMVWFNLDGADFQDGYYTIAKITSRVWYAYADGIYNNAGYWDQPDSWTLSAQGDYLNPENYTPATSPSKDLDMVIIPQGKKIVIRHDGYANPVLDVREGTLDFGNTTGHVFNTIQGSGTIRLQNDNFPDGDASLFAAETGGTVEYYGSENTTLTTDRVFNNVLVNLSGITNHITLNANYLLNGNLTIQTGILQLNSDNHPDPVIDIRKELIIKKNWEIKTNGQFRVGKANTNNAALYLDNTGPFKLAGGNGLNGVLPGNGKYHLIYNQIEIWGDFINRGTAKFTNQQQPIYNQLNGYSGNTDAFSGSAVVWLKGSSDNIMDLYGTTDFYHLIIDKGTGPEPMLTLQSEDEAHFRLFGSNLLGGTGGGLNPEMRKALWIKNGTLHIKSNIHIPTLNEGNGGGSPNGDFYVPTNGALWIDGGKVYGTADNQDQTEIGGIKGLLLATDGLNKNWSGSTQSTSFYGDFRITEGIYSARKSGGFIAWSQGSPVITIEGGLMDGTQFRSAGGHTSSNKVSLIIRGGMFNLRGNIESSGLEAIKGSFSLLGEHNVMIWENGIIRVWDGIDNSNSGGVFQVDINTANASITGGKLQIMMDKDLSSNLRNNYFIQSSVPVYDLELLTHGTANPALEPVRLYRELKVLNNLIVDDQIRFYAGRNNTTGPFYDLEIQGDFVLGQTNSSTARYFSSSDDGTLGNTTLFSGSEDSDIILLSDDPAQKMNFHRLVIDKFESASVRIVSEGRAAADISDHSTQQSPLSIKSGLTIQNGVFDYNGFLVHIDETVELHNHGIIGLSTDPTGYLALGNNLLVMNISPVVEAHFGRLLVAEDVQFTGGDTFRVGDLHMRNGVIRLDNIGLLLDGELINDQSGGNDFGPGKMILTRGNHSDRGIKRLISGDGLYNYPLGVRTADGLRYTPAQIKLSQVPATGGWVQVNNVDNELATLNASSEQALQYYWRIRHEGFDPGQMPLTENMFEFYDLPPSYLTDPSHPDLTTGKVVEYIRKHTLGDAHWNSSTKHLELVFKYLNTNDNTIPSPLEAGEFTAAHHNRFAGTIEIFYSFRNVHNLYGNIVNWNDPNGWSISSHNSYSNPGNKIPGAGDIVFLGHDNFGHWHRVRTSANLQLAELVFNYAAGKPRPRFTLEKTHTANIGVIRGIGQIEVLIDANNSPTLMGDLGDYLYSQNSSFLYNCAYTGAVAGHIALPDFPTEFPNLVIQASVIKSSTNAPHFGDVTFSFNKDITVNHSMSINGGAILITGSGAEGNIHVRDNLNLSGLRESVLRFNGSGNSRTIRVDGNITLAPTGETNEQVALIDIQEGTTPITHHLFLGGNLTMSNGSNVDIDLSNSTSNVVAELHLVGDIDAAFTSTNTVIPEFYRVVVDKGINQERKFDFNSDFNLTGPTTGNGVRKSLELINGTVVLNHADIDINLTTGNNEFQIPVSSGLVVKEGKVRASGNNTGIYLAGLLRLEQNGEAIFFSGSNNTYIHYSAGGTAQLQIYDAAKLTVGSQIRGTTSSVNAGVLKYHQTGGEVMVSRSTHPDNDRAAFEVFNPGSEFIMEGGKLTLIRSNMSSSRAEMYLDPEISSINETAEIYFGLKSVTPANHTIRVNSSVPLSNVFIDGSSTTLRAAVLPLTIDTRLEIYPGNKLDMMQLQLNIDGNLVNNGTSPLFNESRTVLRGIDQEIHGINRFNKLIMNPQSSVSLFANLEVMDSLVIQSGIIYDQGYSIYAKKDVVNNGQVSSGSGDSGGLVFNGATLQQLSGSGSYDRVEIDNSFGVRFLSDQTINKRLVLSLGIVSIQNHRLSLGLDCLIEGAPFHTGKMISTPGGLEAKGLEKRISSAMGPFSFLFPVGIPGKYTPVVLEHTSSSGIATIAATPLEEQHVTTIDFNLNRVLQHHWRVASNGLNSFEGNLIFTYDEDDLQAGDASEYIPAWLSGDSWTKLATTEFDESTRSFEFIHESINDISGFYTAGYSEDIPLKVATYRSKGDGSWTSATSWEKTDPAMPDVPANGPFGHIVEILNGHTITIEEDRRRSYITRVHGNLVIGETSQHNLGQTEGGGTISINRGLLPAGDFAPFFNTSGSTIIYGGTQPYTITDRYLEIQNIVIRGSSLISLPNKPLTVNGSFSVTGSATAIINESLAISGDLTKENSANIQANDEIIFNGTVSQNLSGNFTGGSVLEVLSVNNPTGGLSLNNGNTEVRGKINLQNGSRIFTSADNMLYLKNQNPYGNIHAQSYINGPLQRFVSHNSTSSLYILGKDNIRRDLYLLTPQHGSGMQYWTAEYFHLNPIDEIGDEFAYPPFHSIHEQEYWKVLSPGTGNNETGVGLTYGEDTYIDETHPDFINSIGVAWYDTNLWQPAAAASSYSFNVTLENNVVESTLLIDFLAKNSERYFTLASKNPLMPLPVELLSFKAETKPGFIELTWVTATEINNDFFTIEKSTDGLHFSTLGHVVSIAENGNSNRVLSYNFDDLSPQNGKNYYRLKQTDKDGTEEYHETIVVNYHEPRNINLVLFPNPNTGNSFRIAASGVNPNEALNLDLYDIYGRQVYGNRVYADGSGNINEYVVPQGRLKPGAYVVILSGRSGQLTTRLLVQ